MCHLAEQLEDFLFLGFYAYHFEKCTKNQIDHYFLDVHVFIES